MDLILDRFFITLGGTDFLIAIISLFLTYVIILSLVDYILD